MSKKLDPKKARIVFDGQAIIGLCNHPQDRRFYLDARVGCLDCDTWLHVPFSESGDNQ